MTDTKRVDIEVVDKVSTAIDDKIKGIAASARDAHKELNRLNEMIALAGKQTSVVDTLSRLGLAEVRLSTAQAKLAKELELVNNIHIRSEILLRKEATALDLVAQKAAKLAAIKPINLASNLDSQFGIGSSSKSALSSYSSLASVDNSITKEKANSAQNGFNQFLGINSTVAKSARDSASAFTEAAKEADRAAKELAGYQDQADTLRARLDPLSVATRQHGEAIAMADNLLKRNLITTNEHVAATTIANKQYLQSERAIKAMGGGAGLANHQMVNLGYQLNDVFVSLSSGQKPLTVFIQQGSQIAQIFGETGVKGALKGIASYLGSFLTIGRVAFTGVASAAAITAYAFSNYINEQKQLTVAAKGIGSYARISVEALDKIALTASKTANVSVSASKDMVKAFLLAGNANEENLLKAASVSTNLIATLGMDAEAGQKFMTMLFSDPLKGASELNAKLNTLDVTKVKYIKQLVEQGEKEKAVGVILDSLDGKLLNQNETLTQAGRLWANLSKFSSDAMASLGKGAEFAIFGPPQQKKTTVDNGQLTGLSSVANNLSLALKAADAEFNKVTNDTTEFVTKFDDFNGKIEGFDNSIVKINKSLDMLRTKITQTNDEAAKEGFTEQVAGLEKAKAALIGARNSLETYGDTQTRLVATNNIELALINARTTAERAGLSAKRELISLAGSELSLTEQQIRANQVAAVIIATVKKQRDDEIYALKEENKLIGMLGPQRQLETELMQLQIAARASGNTLNATEIAQRRELLIVKQQGAMQDAVTNSLYDETIGKMQSFGLQLNAINTLYEKGAYSSEIYALKLNKLGLEATDLRLKLGNGDYVDLANASLGKLVSNYEGVLPGLSNSFGTFFQGVNDGFADSIGRAIVMSEDLDVALKQVAQQAIAGLISSLIKLGVQYAVNAALGQSLAAAQMTASTAMGVTQATVLAAAWAPAAAAVSLATSGANAVGANAAIIQTNILTKAMALPGFADGGLIGGAGTGTSDSILARVSNGEFIMNAKATNDNLPLLQAINSGMNINRMSAPTINGNSGSGNGQMKVTVINNSSSKIEVEQLSPTEIRIIAQEESKRAVNEQAPRVIANSLSNPNSKVSKAVSSHTTAGRRR